MADTPIVVLFLAISIVGVLLTTNANREDIIDLKTHTHAADGSINGIRGWY